MTSSEIVTWSARPAVPERRSDPSNRKLVFTDLDLKPNWYRLRVWVEGPAILVSAKVSFFEARRADMRLLLEPIKRRRRLEKVFKIAEPATSLSIGAEGPRNGSRLTRIEIAPLNGWSIFTFLFMKGARYALRKRNRLNIRDSWRHLRAALRPRANFAFQGHYDDADSGAAYQRWQAIHEDPAGAALFPGILAGTLAGRTARVALVMSDTIDKEASGALIRSISAGMPTVELRPVAPAAIASGASQQDWDFVLPLDRPGIFAPQAVERLLLQLLKAPDSQAVFADSDRVNAQGMRNEPAFKPPFWDRELLWCQDYIRAPLLMRWNAGIPEALARPGGARKPSYALALMAACRYRTAQLEHLPAVLFHETGSADPRERQVNAELVHTHLLAIAHPARPEIKDGIVRVGWPLPRNPTISIIIPSKDNPQLLKACIDSIRHRTRTLEPEIIVADNGSVRPATLSYLRQLELAGIATVVPCPGPFNFSKINNDARRHATGEILVFLNDDTRILSENWLVEMASLAARPEAGAVGALLLYPDGTVQHAGIILGMRGIADHAFRHEDGAGRGYLDLLRSRREMAAVTGACLAVSAGHFDAVGGFDESLAVTANDIDLCLRLRKRGWKTIWTPWAVLEHAESKTRGIDHTDAAIERQARETMIFNTRWGELLDLDPTYNPGLSRVAPDYRLGIE